MRRFAVGLSFLLLAATGVQADDPSPAALLAAGHRNHADLIGRGLKSFKAALSLRRADEDSVARLKDVAKFTYGFTAPDLEEFDFQQVPEVLRKPLRDSLTGVWREMTGALWFAEFEGAQDLTLDATGPLHVVKGTGKAVGAFQASLDKSSGRLVEARIASESATRAWTSLESDQGFRPRRRDVSVGENLVYSVTFDALRDVRGFMLPTVLRFDVKGKRTEFLVEYKRLNDAVAWASEFDLATVKAKVEELEKDWKGLSDEQKVARLRDVAEIPHDLASAAIARLALKDASAEVREQAAEALGVMNRINVVPALIAALPVNEKEIRVYLRLIEALGVIGDVRAVDPLSKDWWNQRIPGYGIVAAKAKIRALGNIRHVTAVDALLDTFTLAADDTINLLRTDIVDSLVKLTHQNFLFDRKAWNEWWKKNRSTHRF